MGKNKSNQKKKSTWKRALWVALGTFFFAIFISANSQMLLSDFNSLPLAFLLLGLIILVGIVFDIIGIAATAAHEAPLHARAARRLLGAKHSIWIVRNADQVANFCNDVVGDICGTVSGAVGASIAFSVAQYFPAAQALLVGTVMTGLVAALTVGGKAAGKKMGIDEADKIVIWVGNILARFGKLFGKKGPARDGRKRKV